MKKGKPLRKKGGAKPRGPVSQRRGRRLPEMEKLSCANCRPPCPLADLPLQETQFLRGLIRSVSFVPQQMLFEQGDLHTGLHLICEGWVLLYGRTVYGRRLAMELVGPGDVVGAGSFLHHERHEMSAQAVTNVGGRYLTRAACERLAQEPSLLASRLLVALARRVMALRRQARLFAARASVRERLAALLVELGHRCGQELASGGKRIELKLGCELLGEMLDSHRATVNEELCELRRRGLIAREAGRIVILNETALRKLTENVNVFW